MNQKFKLAAQYLRAAIRLLTAEQFKPGDRVLLFSSPWKQGVITEIRGNTYLVKWNDGSSSFYDSKYLRKIGSYMFHVTGITSSIPRSIWPYGKTREAQMRAVWDDLSLDEKLKFASRVGLSEAIQKAQEIAYEHNGKVEVILLFPTSYTFQLKVQAIWEEELTPEEKEIELLMRHFEEYPFESNKESSIKTAKIVKEKGKWCVKSEKGKNLGCYDTKKEAEERLKQVEMFKHMKKEEGSKTPNTHRRLNMKFKANKGLIGEIVSRFDSKYGVELMSDGIEKAYPGVYARPSLYGENIIIEADFEGFREVIYVIKNASYKLRVRLWDDYNTAIEEAIDSLGYTTTDEFLEKHGYEGHWAFEEFIEDLDSGKFPEVLEEFEKILEKYVLSYGVALLPDDFGTQLIDLMESYTESYMESYEEDEDIEED